MTSHPSSRRRAFRSWSLRSSSPFQSRWYERASFIACGEPQLPYEDRFQDVAPSLAAGLAQPANWIAQHEFLFRQPTPCSVCHRCRVRIDEEITTPWLNCRMGRQLDVVRRRVLPDDHSVLIGRAQTAQVIAAEVWQVHGVFGREWRNRASPTASTRSESGYASPAGRR